MSMGKDGSIRLCETRNATLILSKDGKRVHRAGRFLAPCARNEEKAVCIPDTPVLSEIWDPNLQEWSSKVLFQGWKIPQNDWKEWVDNLEPRYNRIWRKSGIYDSIMSSTYVIRCNYDLVLGLAEFWCPQTNTFVFPWGEATITLEDVMVLGGYPVLGESVTAMPTRDLTSMVDDLENERKEFAKGASFSSWLKKYKGRGDEFEHLAFLSLWLSKFVFPYVRAIGKNVFPIAVRLSRGLHVALAPAVLASLYKDLKLITEHAKIQSELSISVVAPFLLLQLWAFERFQQIGPKPNVLQRPDEPRVARLHRLISKTNLPLVRSALKIRENYKWRPYASDLENWHALPYSDTDEFYADRSNLSREVRRFAKCIESGELAGLGFTVKYMPHRVAMQFGLDQDLPAPLDNPYITLGCGGLFVPSKFFEAGVSENYLEWWEKSMSARQVVMERRRNQSKFKKNRLQTDTPRRQTPLNQANFPKTNWSNDAHRTEERRFGTYSSSCFPLKMEDSHYADSQCYSKSMISSTKSVSGSCQGAALKKKGGSYEKVSIGPYKYTGRLEGTPGPLAVDANVSANHLKRKAADDHSSDSHDHIFQDRKMKLQRIKGPFNDHAKQDSSRRFTKTNAGNSCRVCRVINHKGHKGIAFEKRLERIEKILGVASIQSQSKREST